jgi:hypothetical protein
MFLKISVSFMTVTLTSLSIFASMQTIDREVYRCSDGATYALIRHHVSSWGREWWNLIAFCSEKTLTQTLYSVADLDPDLQHEEITSCKAEESEAITKCWEEFILINGVKGAALTPIIHGRDQDCRE